MVLRQVGSKQGLSLGDLEGVAEEEAEDTEELEGDGEPQALEFEIEATTRQKGKASDEPRFPT